MSARATARDSAGWPHVGMTVLSVVVSILALSLAGGSPLPAEEPAPGAGVEPVEARAETQAGAGAGPRKFRRRQRRPISLGTSGGNVFDIAAQPSGTFCCSGTLGALVEKNGTLFVLSNNHVLAVSNDGAPGDPVGQPGMLDSRCPPPEADTVAHLSQFKKIKFGANKRNKVDAALAEVVEGTVKTNGRILKIGIPGDSAVEPEIGMAVRKSGRTSGHTRGTILDVNATITVEYPRSCGSEEGRRARFRRQFVVVGNSRDFSAGGDSGSVIYEDVKDCPRAVGLLFAGAEQFTFANPMQTVLNVMEKRRPRGPVRLVGCSSSTGGSAERERLSQRGLLVQAAMASQERYEEAVLDLPGVVGMGIGLSSERQDELVLRVYLTETSRTILDRIPLDIEGFRVEILETGPIVAY